MAIAIIEAVGPVASWRPPEALTYQRTLPLPPYTTLVGMLGAALGLSLPEAFGFVSERGLRLGIGGWHEGQGRDLWKFQKLESIAEAKPIKTDVLLREFWSGVHLAVVIEAPSLTAAKEVARAFEEPCYPLTAGPSDSLLKVVAARVEKAGSLPTRRLAYTMAYGELPPAYKLAEDWESIPLSRILRAPAIEKLPTGFEFEPDSPRRLRGRSPVTFIADPIELDEEVEAVQGYAVEPRSRALREHPVYRTLEEQQPWIIPVHRYDSPSSPPTTSSTGPSPSGRTTRRGKSDNRTGST